MNKVTSNNYPKIIEEVGNGSYLYHFNIEEVSNNNSAIVHSENNTENIKSYKYDEVVVWSPISSDAITKAVMNYLWSKDAEQKYINDYNAATLGILDSSYIDAYKDFMTQRKSIKEQIDKDYNEYLNSQYLL